MVGSSVLGLVGCPSAIERPADRLLATLWVGLLTLATALLALSIVAPLRPHWCALMAAGLSLPALWSKESLQTLKAYRGFCTLPVVLGVLAIALAAAWFVLRGTLLEDARMYHIPRVRWYSEYGTVFGLALLEPHLGFTSTWHALTAPFDVGIFRGRAYALANGFVCLLFAVNFLLVGRRICQGKMLDSDWFLTIASVIYFENLIRRYTQIVFSPSPDVIVTFSIVMICWLFLIESKPSGRGLRAAWLCSLGASGLKLSLAPLVAISTLVELWGIRTSFFLLRRFSVVLIAYVVPFLAVQFISTGFPLYPSTILGLGTDWAIDAQTAELEAKLPAFTVPFGFHPTLSSETPSGWIQMFSNLAKNQSYFIFLSFVNISFCIWLVFFKNLEGIFRIIPVLGLIGNIFVFAAGPDIRYGFGFVHIGPVVFAHVWILEWMKNKEEKLKLNFSERTFWWFLLIEALTFLPLRVSTGAAILALVGGSALVLLPFRHSAWLRTSRLPWQWSPLVAALTVAAGLAATACARDATEMAIESYAGAGLLRLPENSVSTWLLPPPTIRFYLTRGPNGELIPANSRYEIKTVRGYQYVYPVKGLCGDAELPCGSFGIRPDIIWRDPKRGLAGGFSRAE